MRKENPELYKIESTDYSNFQRQLTPHKDVDFVLDTGDDDRYGDPTGATLRLQQHGANKYHEAQGDDPGALFSYHRPSVELLYSTKGEGHNVPALLALAHEHSVKQMGAVPTHSTALSPYSEAVVKKAIQKGHLIRNPEWESDYESTPDEIHSRKRNAQMSAETQIQEHVENARDMHYEEGYPHGPKAHSVEDWITTHKSTSIDEDLARGHRMARDMLGSEHPSKVSKQFWKLAPKSGEQMELF